MKLNKEFSLVPIVAALMTFGTSAVADTQSYTLGVGNAALGALTGPYASVLVDRATATTAWVTFESFTSGGYIYLMGDGSSVGVNVNATAWSVSNITSLRLAGFSAGAISDDGSKNVSDFGVFNQTFKTFDGFTNSSYQVSFELTNTSGTWANASSVLTANASGYLAEIHGFACAEPGCTTSSGAAVTGFAANTVTAIPEPETYAMLLAGLGLIGFIARRRKMKLAA